MRRQEILWRNHDDVPRRRHSVDSHTTINVTITSTAGITTTDKPPTHRRVHPWKSFPRVVLLSTQPCLPRELYAKFSESM